MKKFLFIIYVFFEFIGSAIGFAVIVIGVIALLSKEGCISIDSPIFGKYEKEACTKQEKDR